MKIVVFWNVMLCNLLYKPQSTWCYIPEDNNLHTLSPCQPTDDIIMQDYDTFGWYHIRLLANIGCSYHVFLGYYQCLLLNS
jgi:hypothetical protein